MFYTFSDPKQELQFNSYNAVEGLFFNQYQTSNQKRGLYLYSWVCTAISVPHMPTQM